MRLANPVRLETSEQKKKKPSESCMTLTTTPSASRLFMHVVRRIIPRGHWSGRLGGWHDRIRRPVMSHGVWVIYCLLLGS